MTTDSVEIDLGGSYRVLDELPGYSAEGGLHHFPDGKGAGSGVIVRFEPAGAASWIGVFRPGDGSSQGHTGIHPHPAAGKLCVIVRGAAYEVEPARPESTRVLDYDPVMQVWPVPSLRLLLLSDPWEIFALGAEGERWRTGRIALDGLKMDGQQGDFLCVTAGDLEQDIALEIELVSGKLRP